MGRQFLHLDVSAQSPVTTECHVAHRRPVVSLVPPKLAQEAHLSLLTVVNSFACLALFFAFCLKGHDFFWLNILTQLGTIIDTFDDIRSLLELFRNSNQDLNNAKYAARHIYA